MSVTFSPAYNPADTVCYTVKCVNNPETDATVVVGVTHDYADAKAYEARHLARCGGCAFDRGCWIDEESEAPEVNMSNANARRILAILDLGTEDLCGEADPAVFAERVAFAAVVHGGDPGTGTIEYQSGNGPLWIDCGRPAGYTDMRLEQLREIAVWAAARGRAVTWG